MNNFRIPIREFKNIQNKLILNNQVLKSFLAELICQANQLKKVNNKANKLIISNCHFLIIL